MTLENGTTFPYEEEAPTLPESTASDERQPIEEELPEKYRGKSSQELAEMHKQAERAMHEASMKASHLEREFSSLKSQYESDRERLYSSRERQDPLAEKFKTIVAEDPNVYNTVREVSQSVAREVVSPELNTLYQQNQSMQAQMYNMYRENYFKTDPEASTLQEDMAVAGTELGKIMVDHLKSSGVSEKDIQKVWNGMNVDPRLLPWFKSAARGLKPADYFVSKVKPKTHSEKADLGGGGQSGGSSGQLSPEEFSKLPTAKQREYLEKQGLM
ncbi:MAG: hypothetical protein KBF73_10755 [Flavobacteriales bacterium]|nr:hypothetical protein [Flavobacteriales bacterium]